MNMRVLRFLRPERSAAAALPAGRSGEALGVEAFATEAAARVDGAPPSDRHRPALVALAVVVALEAIPTALWFQSRFAVETPVASAAPQPAAAPPAAVAAAAPPCTVAPASATAFGPLGAE